MESLLLFPKLFLKLETLVRSHLLSQTTSLCHTISACELDGMVHALIHHASVTHRTEHKEKLRMGFRLPKIVMLLLVPKEADFQITAYTTYSERGRKVILKTFRGRQCF